MRAPRASPPPCISAMAPIVAAAAKVTQGFLGDRSKYAGFGHNLDSDDLSWTCSGSQRLLHARERQLRPAAGSTSAARPSPISAAVARATCRRTTRACPISWRPSRAWACRWSCSTSNGFPAAWGWSSKALKRMGDIVSRSDAAGGTGWNETSMSRQMPWLLNRRYGTNYPPRVNGTGRLIGFTSWLYGSGTNGRAAVLGSADRGGHRRPTVRLQGRVGERRQDRRVVAAPDQGQRAEALRVPAAQRRWLVGRGVPADEQVDHRRRRPASPATRTSSGSVPSIRPTGPGRGSRRATGRPIGWVRRPVCSTGRAAGRRPRRSATSVARSGPPTRPGPR